MQYLGFNVNILTRIMINVIFWAKIGNERISERNTVRLLELTVVSYL